MTQKGHKSEIKVSSIFDVTTNIEFYKKKTIANGKLSPTVGHQLFFQLNYYLNNNSKFLIGYKKSENEYTIKNLNMYKVLSQKNNKVYVKYKYKINDDLKQNFEIQIVNHHKEIKTDGILLSYEIVKKWKLAPIDAASSLPIRFLFAPGLI